jgi:hypothetical protein
MINVCRYRKQEAFLELPSTVGSRKRFWNYLRRAKKQHEHFNVTDNVHYVLLSTMNTGHHFGLIATMCPIIRMCEVK